MPCVEGSVEAFEISTAELAGSPKQHIAALSALRLYGAAVGSRRRQILHAHNVHGLELSKAEIGQRVIRRAISGSRGSALYAGVAQFPAHAPRASVNQNGGGFGDGTLKGAVEGEPRTDGSRRVELPSRWEWSR